jgi:DEAD/DEAH box helicase
MNNAYKILLALDFQVAATSIGLEPHKGQPLVTEQNLYMIMNEIEIALLEGDKDRQISSVCGLLWTHFSDEFNLLGEYIFNTMARIGFPPVISMLSNSKDADARLAYSSLFSMFETAAQMQREKLQIFGETYTLTRFQKNLWMQIEGKSHIGVSAPTSAGKSFLICLSLIYGTAKRQGISIYVVPTLTLMGQVANDLIGIIRKHGQSISVRTHLSDEADSAVPIIFVVTQERIADYGRTLRTFGKLNFLVVDEVQNIERAFDSEAGDTRAKLLFDVIVDLHDNYLPEKTIIIGPRISEINALGQTLFRKIFTPVNANSSPVTNICYSLSPSIGKNKVTLTQYSELSDKHTSKTYENLIGATGFGKARYDENYFLYIEKILSRNEGSLIFSPTANQARKTAVRISGGLAWSNDPMIHSLCAYVKRTVSPQYDLVTCIGKGVAYHHGKIPHHVRNAIELAIVQGRIPFVACTTTLMQGVNIPAKNVFLRNPNLFVQNRGDGSVKLSGYEIANLRGRAGRLLKDFVGRTFIMDGTSFKEAEDQQSLFEPATKTLDGSYSKIFQRTRGEIVDSLIDVRRDRGTLAKYIANVLYTDPAGAVALLRKGISLSERELIAIKSAQQKINIPREICRTHRFRDPFDLQKIKDEMSNLILPIAPFSPDAVKNLEKILIKIFSILPEQSTHYMKTNEVGRNKPLVLAISAVDWASEKPLSDLLNSDFARESSENTEKVISDFQNIISYGMPSLLSPLYSLFLPKSILLGAIERGAHQQGAIAQINNNIPRETAIAVIKRAKTHGEILNTMTEVLTYLKRTKVDYWSAIQFRHIVAIEEIIE